ncbi:MAG: NHL repeat-containing protein [Egibacteraceae bacterium]
MTVRALERQEVAHALADLVREFGADRLQNPGVVRSLLADRLGPDSVRCRPEIDLVAEAIAAGTPVAIATTVLTNSPSQSAHPNAPATAASSPADNPTASTAPRLPPTPPTADRQPKPPLPRRFRTVYASTAVLVLVLAAVGTVLAVQNRAGKTPAPPGVDPSPATSVQLNYPGDLAVAADGTLYIAERGNDRVRKVDPSGTITTVAGTGVQGFSGDGGPATAANLYYPYGVTVDTDGTLYIAEWGNNRVRKVNSSGTITTVAGTGTQGFSGDSGPATAANLSGPDGVAIAADGNLYITEVILEEDNHRVRKVDHSGTIITVAGTGIRGFSGDGGPATAANLFSPIGVAVTTDGALYIADADNCRVRKVDYSGTIITVAGTGTCGFSGDGGPATAANLDNPADIAVTADGTLYIADSSNHRVRKVDLSGTITTVAGTGTQGFSGDRGPATAANLSGPDGVAIAADGTLYIADSSNHRVRKVDPSGIITTVAGRG